MHQQTPKIAIIGAGIGGLTAAIALNRAGLRTVVLERAVELRSIGFGITLQTNAVQALARIGMAEAVCKEGIPIERVTIRLHQGKLVHEIPTSELGKELGQPSVCIHRGKLQQLLLEKLGRRQVDLGVRVAEIEDWGNGIRLIRNDGTVDSADAVIGADGLRSFTRKEVFGEVGIKQARYVAWRGICRNFGLVPHGEANESWGRGRRFGYLPVDNKHLYWFATETARPGQTEWDDSPQAMLKRFGDWHPPIGEIVGRTDNESICRSAVCELPALESWSRGRVALLGDAAHAMTPNLGQGGGLAIEDAIVLAKAYSPQVSIEHWLTGYYRRRLRRTRMIVNQSRRLGLLAQGDNQLRMITRNHLLPRLPRPFYLSHLKRLLSFHD